MSTRDEDLRKQLTALHIPVKPFLYTLDQLADMISINRDYFNANYVWYEGRKPGIQPRDLLLARNVAPINMTPDWRVLDMEVIRWFRRKKYVIYERGWAK